MPDHSIIQKTWGELTTDELYAILRLRTDVFYVEQKVDESELDDRDREPATKHVWIADADRVVAYLRVIEDATPEYRDATRLIGRVVVAPAFRGRGLAQRLLSEVIGQFGHEALLLHSQSYIAPLYAGFGFERFGEDYDEAGIAHTSMYRAGIAAS